MTEKLEPLNEMGDDTPSESLDDEIRYDALEEQPQDREDANLLREGTINATSMEGRFNP